MDTNTKFVSMRAGVVFELKVRIDKFSKRTVESFFEYIIDDFFGEPFRNF